MQGDVMDVLIEMGYTVRSEYTSPDGLALVDIALLDEHGAPLAVVEVDGPWHYSLLDPSAETGSTMVRNKLLRAWGWQVVVLTNLEWTSAGSLEEQQQLLSRKLDGLV